MDLGRLLKIAVKRGALSKADAESLVKRFGEEKRPERALLDAKALDESALRAALREMRSGLAPDAHRAFERFEDKLLARAIEEAKLAPKPAIEAALKVTDAEQAKGKAARLVDHLVEERVLDEEAATVAQTEFRATVVVCDECFARLDRKAAKGGGGAGAGGDGPPSNRLVECTSCRARLSLSLSVKEKTKPERKKSPSGRGKRARRKLKQTSQAAAKVVAAESDDEAESAPKKKSPLPVLLVGGGALVALIVVLAVAMGTSSPPPPAPPSPPPPPPSPSTPPPPPPPPAKGDWDVRVGPLPPAPGPATNGPLNAPEGFDSAIARTKPLVRDGRYDEARAILARLSGSSDTGVRDAVRLEIERIDKLILLTREAAKKLSDLDAAQGPDREEKSIELAGWWRSHLEDRGLAPMAPVTSRIQEERRARLARGKERAAARLAAVKKALAEGGKKGPIGGDQPDWSARLALVRDATTKKPLEAKKTNAQGKELTWKGLVVTGLDAKGYKVEQPTTKHVFFEGPWSEGIELGLKVLELARRTGDAERALDLAADAQIAWDGRRREQARALWEERARLVPGSQVPDIDAIEKARPYSVDPEATDGGTRSRFTFVFDDASPHDWRPASGNAPPEVSGGKLAVRLSYVELARRVETEDGVIDLEADLAATEMAPFVGIDLEHEDRSRTLLDISWQHREDIDVATLALEAPKPRKPDEIDLPRPPSDWKQLAQEKLGDAARKPGGLHVKIHFAPASGLEVTVGGKKIALSSQPSVGRVVMVTPRLGTLLGQATFERVTLTAPIRGTWLRKLAAEYDRVLTAELAKGRGGSGRGGGAFGAGAPPTTEDPFELAGVPKDALKALRVGRAALAKGDDKEAGFALEIAARIGAPFPAALLLRARADARANPWRALDALEELLAFMPDCPEAFAQRALIEASIGQADKADADMKAALELRPDLSIAYQARGFRAFAMRRPEVPGDAADAATDLELAAALDPDDVALGKEARAARRMVEGPWPGKPSVRATTEHYVLLTDTDPKTVAAVSATLEEAWRTFAEAFPPPEGPWKRSEVVVFFVRSDFLDWANAFSFGMAATSTGFYDPWHDQLVLYESLDDRSLDETRDTTTHEAFHQYAQRVLPPIPNWLNEGLAQSFGIPVRKKGTGYSAETLRALALPPGPTVARATWREYLAKDYDAFHDLANQERGRRANYARAWVVASVLREKKGKLGRVLPALLDGFKNGEHPQAVQDRVFDDATLDRLEAAFEAKLAALTGS